MIHGLICLVLEGPMCLGKVLLLLKPGRAPVSELEAYRMRFKLCIARQERQDVTNERLLLW